MEPFISWSGKRSKEFAQAIHDWLPKVIQCLKPWMSSSDIDKGDKWLSVISDKLKKNNFGLICLTNENINEPWILFEAGALSSAIGKSHVCSILFDFDPSSLTGPLSQFQATKFYKDDMLELLKTINKNLDSHQLTDHQLAETFNVWWPLLEEEINKVPKSQNKQPERTEKDMLEEIIMFTRAFSQNYFRQKWEFNLSNKVRWMLAHLSPKEEKVLRLMHGIGENKEYSIKEIAKRINVSQAEIKRILKKAYSKLREFRVSEFFEPFDDN